MPKQIFWLVSRSVEITRHRSRKIAKSNMDSHSRTTLVAPCQIVTQPSDVAGKRGIDATSRNKDTGIDEAGKTAVSRGRDGDDEADEDEQHGDEDEGRAAISFAVGVGVEGHKDGEERGGDIDRDCEELGGGGFVAELGDDGGEEEGDTVERADDTPVHLPILILVRDFCLRGREGEKERAGRGKD